MLNTNGKFLEVFPQQLFDSWQPSKKKIQKSCEGHEIILTSAVIVAPSTGTAPGSFHRWRKEWRGGFAVGTKNLLVNSGTWLAYLHTKQRHLMCFTQGTQPSTPSGIIERHSFPSRIAPVHHDFFRSQVIFETPTSLFLFFHTSFLVKKSVEEAPKLMNCYLLKVTLACLLEVVLGEASFAWRP